MTAAASPSSRLVLLARDIKLSHSVFALPFALLATFLAAAHRQRWPSVGELALILVCMVLARTMAMAVNRWADAKLDALNPRTKGRAIPSGRLSASFVFAVALACAAGFIAATSGFWWLNGNPWPLVFSPAVIAWLALYSFAKRYTALCHLVLGVALALSPVAATVAIDPTLMRQAEPYLLFAMVTCWVAGFDVIYALQDVGIDQTLGLFSLPSRIGVEPALWISRLLHALAVASLIALWRVSPPLGALFAVGVIIVVGLLALEHALVWRSRTHHINMAFFTVNGIISLLLGGLGIVDILRGSRW